MSGDQHQGEPDALSMWFRHRRALWWKKWRWAVIGVATTLVVATGLEILGIIAFRYDGWPQYQPLQQKPFWADAMSTFHYNWGGTVHPILLAVCVATAFGLQISYFTYLQLQKEQMLAINERTLAARLRRMAIMQPLVVFAIGILLVFIIDFSTNYLYQVEIYNYLSADGSVLSMTATDYVMNDLITNPLFVILPGICATLGCFLVCIAIATKKPSVIVMLLPSTLYLLYWVIMSLLNRGMVSPTSIVLVFLLIIPLIQILAAISFAVSHRPYWLRER